MSLDSCIVARKIRQKMHTKDAMKINGNSFLLALSAMLLSCTGWSQLMVGSSETLPLDTLTEDVQVYNSNWFHDGNVSLRLSTRWGETATGHLTVNGNVRMVLSGDVEKEFILFFPANSTGSYVCEWTVGETIYRRTFATKGNRKVEHGEELALDTKAGIRWVSASGEKLFYDAQWAEGATAAVISCADEEIARGVVGSYMWLPRFAGNNILSLSLQDCEGREIAQERALFKADAAFARIDEKFPWGPGLFEGCVGIRDVLLDCDLTRFALPDGSFGPLTLKDLFPDSYASLTNVVLDAGVTALPDGFFDGCVALENVTFPSTLKDFGNSDWRLLGEQLGKQGLWVENDWDWVISAQRRSVLSFLKAFNTSCHVRLKDKMPWWACRFRLP